MGVDGRNVRSRFHNPERPAFVPCLSTVSENHATNRGAGRHPASLALKLRFKSLAAARNWVRENPETRPAKSPRAPAAATPSIFFLKRTPQVSFILTS